METSQTPASAPAAKPAVKQAPRPRLTRVAAMKPPEDPVPQPDGSIKFTIQVVTMTGKQEHWACTEAIYKWVLATKPNFKVKSEWVISIDPTSGLVTHVGEAAAPNSMPGFNVTEEASNNPSDMVILALWPDGSITPTWTPDRVSDQLVAEIQSAVSDATEQLRTGQSVGRFIVTERRELPGKTELFIDPMPR